MIINSLNYDVVYPLSTNWAMSVVRKRNTSGAFTSYDYGYSSDVVKNSVTVQGIYSDIESLLIYLQSNREIMVTFDKEKVFGPHIEYIDPIPCVFSNIQPSERINQNLRTVSFDLVAKNLTIKGGIAGTLEGMLYPSSHVGGEEQLNEVSNQNGYGDFYNYHSGSIGVHSLSFSMDEDKSAKLLKQLIVAERGDGIELPTDWESIKPFGEKDYTHAILLGLSFSQSALNEYTIDLKMQSYDNS